MLKKNWPVLTDKMQHLSVFQGGNIDESTIEIVMGSKKLLKKFGEVTKRNVGAGSIQVHIGFTTAAGQQVKEYVYALNGRALSEQELDGLNRSDWNNLKRFGMPYQHKGTEIMQYPIGKEVVKWLEKAGNDGGETLTS